MYDNEQLMLRGLERKEIQCGDVVIIRYEGPTGGPGLPEMLTPTRYEDHIEISGHNIFGTQLTLLMILLPLSFSQCNNGGWTW